LPGPPAHPPTALIYRAGRVLARQPRWPAHEFAESDYRHGTGTIRLRIVYVEWSTSIVREGVRWLATEAIVVDSSGRKGDLRRMLIREERLPAPLARKRPRVRV
jgi:hypothetical protein